MQEMPRSITLPMVLLMMLGVAVGQNDCGNCLNLNSGAVVGIVTCDVIITVLIAGMAFWVSSKVQKKKYEAKIKQKNVSENDDHTYAHLQGQHTDVYTDIKTLQNS